MKYTESAWQLASAFMASNQRFGHNPTEILAEAITKRDAEKDAEIERLRAEKLEMLAVLALLLDAYGQAHALHDLGECEGSLSARQILVREGRWAVDGSI